MGVPINFAGAADVYNQIAMRLPPDDEPMWMRVQSLLDGVSLWHAPPDGGSAWQYEGSGGMNCLPDVVDWQMTFATGRIAALIGVEYNGDCISEDRQGLNGRECGYWAAEIDNLLARLDGKPGEGTRPNRRKHSNEEVAHALAQMPDSDRRGTVTGKAKALLAILPGLGREGARATAKEDHVALGIAVTRGPRRSIAR